MAKIILDKGLDSEFEIEVSSINEDIIGGILSGNKSNTVPPTPEIPELKSDSFTTLDVETDDGEALPIAGTYNKVVNYSTNYYEGEMFNLHIALGYDEV